MTEEKGLEKQQSSLGKTTLTSNLVMSVGLAFERTACEPKEGEVEAIAQDVMNEFKDEDEEVILKGIRAGALGMYGRTYRMSTQEVCIWIRKYIEKNVPKFVGG